MVGSSDWDLFDALDRAGSSVRAKLAEREFVKMAAEITKDKGGGHLAHRIDQVAERAILASIRKARFSGSLFSEEAGVVALGDSESFLVTDPYCNTSLTFRGIRESAMTLYEFGANNTFMHGCIVDLQVPRSLRVSPGSCIMRWDGLDQPTECSRQTELGAAAIVVSLLKRNRRTNPPVRLIERAGILLTIDGGIVALRLCAGEVDAFVDCQMGQPGYEALAYRLVEECGGVVTDSAGEQIDWAQIVRELRSGTPRRQTIVAAANRSLHEQVLSSLNSP